MSNEPGSDAAAATPAAAAGLSNGLQASTQPESPLVPQDPSGQALSHAMAQSCAAAGC